MEKIMEKARRARYKYEVVVNGQTWVKTAWSDLAKAAAQAAKASWAKGKKVEIKETTGILCPF